MPSLDVSIQYLACNTVKTLLQTSPKDDDFFDRIPRTTLRLLTGKSFKKLYKRDAKQRERFEQVCSTLMPCHDIEARLSHNVVVICNALTLPKECNKLLELCILCTVNTGLYELIDEYFGYNYESVSVVMDFLELSYSELEKATVAISSSPLFNAPTSSVDHILTIPKVIAWSAVKDKADGYQDLIQDAFSLMPKPTLTRADFPHVELGDISKYLTIAVKRNIVGVNILLHGESGTGKTTLSEILAKQAKCQLISITAKGGNFSTPANELNTHENVALLRLQYHGLVQSIIQQSTDSILLLDEAEDIFHEYYSGVKVSKERLHHLLETNTTPTIFITNHVSQLPDSVIRRCLVLEVPPPPKNIKLSILSKPLKGLRLSTAFKESLVEIEVLTPAHITSAAHLAKTLNLKGKQAEQCVQRHIEQTLLACGLPVNIHHYRPEMFFEPRFINLDGSHQNIDEVINTVGTFTGARCLLLGSAGTGKSAMVHYIAELLETELITIKPSDILSKYVGEAEQNIAALFRQAHQSNAIIFLDEVDSVLTSRAELTQSHERVLVNEILLQLDLCEQTVFAATNYAKNLDNALLRRFDFKLNFKYLTSKQIITLYTENIGKLTPALKESLQKLNRLTPGDFAVLSRRNRMSRKPLTDNENLHILTDENNRKAPSKAIGFVN